MSTHFYSPLSLNAINLLLSKFIDFQSFLHVFGSYLSLVQSSLIPSPHNPSNFFSFFISLLDFSFHFFLISHWAQLLYMNVGPTSDPILKEVTILPSRATNCQTLQQGMNPCENLLNPFWNVNCLGHVLPNFPHLSTSTWPYFAHATSNLDTNPRSHSLCYSLPWGSLMSATSLIPEKPSLHLFHFPDLSGVTHPVSKLSILC